MNSRPDIFPFLDYRGTGPAISDGLIEIFSCESLYEKMSRDDCLLLSQYMHSYVAPEQTLLLQEGEDGDFMIVIHSGHVRVTHRDLLGRTLHITDVGSGSVLGEMSLIDGEHRVASCITLDEVKFSVLTRDELNEILYAHPSLANKLLIWVLQNTILRIREMIHRSSFESLK